MSAINRVTYGEKFAADMAALLKGDDPTLVRLHLASGVLEGHLVDGESDRLTVVDAAGETHHMRSGAVLGYCVTGTKPGGPDHG